MFCRFFPPLLSNFIFFLPPYIYSYFPFLFFLLFYLSFPIFIVYSFFPLLVFFYIYLSFPPLYCLYILSSPSFAAYFPSLLSSPPSIFGVSSTIFFCSPAYTKRRLRGNRFSSTLIGSIVTIPQNNLNLKLILGLETMPYP